MNYLPEKQPLDEKKSTGKKFSQYFRFKDKQFYTLADT